MANEINGATAPSVATPSVKKRGRGISNETRATSNLKFHEKDALPCGIFIGIATSAECKWATFGENSNSAFAGQSVPRLDVHFTSIHEDVNLRRHVSLVLNPIPSNTDTYENGEKSWMVEANMRWMKHLLDVFYLNGRELNDKEIDALSLDYNDCDDEGNYLPVENEEVLKSWAKIFTNVAAMLNGTFDNGDKAPTGKPCYVDANNKPIRLFMKLLRYTKSGKGANAKWKAVAQNGELGFPGFVGEGCLEKMKTVDALPLALRLNAYTESITPKKVEENAAPSMPSNIPAGMPGVNLGAGGGYGGGFVENPAAGQMMGDMPF